MTTEELAEATKGFDEEFVADQAKPLTPPLRARWERAKARSARAEKRQASGELRLLEERIDECLSLAKGLDRAALAEIIALLRRARNRVVISREVF
jgi:hypothetical protein